MEVSMTKKNSHRILKYALALALTTLVAYQGAYFLWGEHYLTFFKGIARNPLQVGAFSPCTKFVAQEITKYIAQVDQQTPLRILEVGGGSGIFTTQLEKILAGRAGAYHVDVIEIDPDYCSLLTQRFKNNSNFSIHCINMADFTADQPYDFIVSSLPFNTLDHALVKNILDRYQEIIKPSGIISYIEHIWLPEIKEFFMQGALKQEYCAKRTMINTFRDKNLFETATVYANITPLHIYHLKIDKD